MNVDQKAVLRRRELYPAFWGREADEIYAPDDGFTPYIEVFRFPPKPIRWFFQRWFAPASEDYVYITGGVSDQPMNVPADADIPDRIELTTYSSKIYLDETGERDLAAFYLYALARNVFEEGIFYSPCHTVDMNAPLRPGSAMTAFVLGVTPGVEMGRLCGCAGKAKLMLQVVPISTSELALAKEQGPEAFLDYVDANQISQEFDLDRKPAV